MNDITLRTALPEDRITILALEESGMRPHAEALWGNWRPSATPDTLDLRGHEMIEKDGQTIGCLATEQHADHLRLCKLYIDAAHRNRGIGALALRLMVDRAATLGLPVRLSVLTTNPALHFYRRAGFEIASSTPERHMLVRPAAIPQGSK